MPNLNLNISSKSIKCPVCNSNTMHECKFEDNNLHYFLYVCNTKTKEIYENAGAEVDFYGCDSCGAMILRNPKISSN